MESDFAVETTVNRVDLTREAVENLTIICQPGLCIANSETQTPRKIKWYDENILPKVNDGSDGGWDDRKMRLDYSSFQEGNLVLSFGHSHFGEFKESMNRTYEANEELQRRGLAQWLDRYAFLPRNPGVAALVVTSQGSIFLGERTNEEDNGLLRTVSGHLDFRQDPKEVRLEEDALREIEEEFGIEASSVQSLKFVGGYMNPNRGDMDFSYLAFTDVPNSYFSSDTWKERSSETEHKNLVQLNTYADVQQILSEGTIPGIEKTFNLMYSTRGALQSIKPRELAGGC